MELGGNMGTWIKEPQYNLLQEEQLLFVGAEDGGLLSNAQQCNLNFLWQENDVYIMDNHLAAGWCWLQICDPSGNYNFMHIDQHTDDCCCLSEKRIKDEFQSSIIGSDLGSYCNLSYEKYGERVQLFQCERYIRPLSVIHPSWFGQCVFATHQRRNLTKIQELVEKKQFVDHLHTPQHIEPTDVVTSILRIKNTRNKWIVNIDLDYLFQDEEQILRNDFFYEIGDAIKKVRDSIQIITIALSTPWCNGLQNSLEILSTLTNGIPELKHFSIGEYL